MSRSLWFSFLTSSVAALPAQWSTNPLQNLAIGDRPGDQAVAKIAATADGGCYLAWFDNSGTGYAVYLQRLDAAGVEQWAHGGVLVSNQPQNSSLVDWDLLCAADGSAVVAFTDVRSGPDLDVYTYRVDRSGAMVWGNNGITLSNNTEDEANPRLCQATDGDVVCVWSNSTSRTLRLQRLDAAGNLRFAANGLVIPGDGTDAPSFARVVPGDNGSCIVAWVRALAFSGTRHLHTQKYDAQGQTLWGAQRLAVFDLAILPIAHQPSLVADGAGGAIYAWHYAVGNAFSARVQRVNAAGAEVFPHNGVDVATHAMGKFDPAVVWQPATQSILVFWNERNAGQSSWGISGNRIDAAGNRQWGASGAVLLPVNSVNKLSPFAVPLRDGAHVFVLETSLGPIQHKVLAMRVLDTGALAGPVVEASRVVSEKLRVQVAVSPSGVAMLCWSDRRVDSGDVYAQNVNPDGSLGARLAEAQLYGCSNPVGSFAVTGLPQLGATFTLGVDNPLGTQAVGSLSVFVLAAAPAAGFPCGLAVPGLGMAGNGAPGEVLFDPALPAPAFAGTAWGGVGQPGVLPLTVPLSPSLVGRELFAQGALLDPTPAAIAPIGLSRAARLRFGY